MRAIVPTIIDRRRRFCHDVDSRDRRAEHRRQMMGDESVATTDVEYF